MIKDSINNIYKYRGLSTNLDAVIDHIIANNYCVDYVAGGRIDDDNYYNLCVFGGKPTYNDSYEAHLKYIDLQYVLEGSESFLYQDPRELTECVSYDETKDIYFLNGEGDKVDVKAGEFVVFYPTDAHCGGKGSAQISKLVFKIKV